MEKIELKQAVTRLFSCEATKDEARRAVNYWGDDAGKKYSMKIQDAVEEGRRKKRFRFPRPLPFPVERQRSSHNDETERWVLAAAVHDALCYGVDPVGALSEDIFEATVPRYQMLVGRVELLIDEEWGHVGLDLAQVVNDLIASTPDISNSDDALYVFQKQAEGWRVVYEGHQHLFPNNKGFRLIAELLKNPQKEIDCFVLEQMADPPPPGKNLIAYEQLLGGDADEREASAVVGAGYLGVKANPDSGAEFVMGEEELLHIQSEISWRRDMLDKTVDVMERKALQSQIDEIERFKEADTRIGGRPRLLRSSNEQVRGRVTKAIGRVLDHVEGADARLGSHLRSSINTGLQCSYKPESEFEWNF